MSTTAMAIRFTDTDPVPKPKPVAAKPSPEQAAQIYFHRNAVLDAAFDRLKVGSEVAFAEEEGVKGPQASTVRVVGGHRRA
jgi:cold shock CspA family protein